MFDTLEPEMVPLEVKAENFGGIKGDVFQDLQKKRGLKKSPTAQANRDALRLVKGESYSDLQHIILMPGIRLQWKVLDKFILI